MRLQERDASVIPTAMLAPSLALLRGLANAKSQSKVEDKAREIAEAKASPVEVTTKQDPTTGRTTATIKGVAVGDADAEMDTAYSVPQIDLAAAVAPYARQFGHREPGAPDIKDKMGRFYGRYQLAREAGSGRLGALLRSLMIEARPDRREHAAAERLAADVEGQRLNQAIDDFKTAAPVIAEADRQRRLASADARDRLTEDKTARANFGRTIAATDFTLLDEADWVASVAQQNGIPSEEVDDATRAQIARTGRQQKKKAHESRFDAFRQDNALGHYASAEDAAGAFGSPLSEVERRQLDVDWREKRTVVERAARAEAEREARFDAFVSKLATATAEKPLSFRIGDARVFDAEDIAGYFGAENVDQRSLQKLAQQKIGIVSRQFDELTAEWQAVTKEGKAIEQQIAVHRARIAADESAREKFGPYVKPKHPGSVSHLAKLEDDHARLRARRAEIDKLREPLVRDVSVLKDALRNGRPSGQPTAPTSGAKKVLTAEEALSRL